MQQPAKPVPAINYDVVRKFLENPSVPANQIALLSELLDTWIRDKENGALTGYGLDPIIALMESRLLNTDKTSLNTQVVGSMSDTELNTAKKYISALLLLVENVIANKNNPDEYIKYCYSLTASLGVLLYNGAIPSDTEIKLDPMVKNSLLYKFSLQFVKDAMANDTTIDSKTKIQLIALIGEIEQLRAEDPALTSNCTEALIAIEKLISDPTRPKERLLQDLSTIFSTFFNDIKNDQTLGSLYAEASTLCGEEPEKTVTCATLLIQSLRIITTPKLTKDKAFLENYNKTAHSTNNGLVLTAIKAIINAAYSKIINQSSFFKDRAVVEKSQKAMVEHFKAEASESTETTAPKL